MIHILFQQAVKFGLWTSWTRTVSHDRGLMSFISRNCDCDKSLGILPMCVCSVCYLSVPSQCSIFIWTSLQKGTRHWRRLFSVLTSIPRYYFWKYFSTDLSQMFRLETIWRLLFNHYTEWLKQYFKYCIWLKYEWHDSCISVKVPIFHSNDSFHSIQLGQSPPKLSVLTALYTFLSSYGRVNTFVHFYHRDCPFYVRFMRAVLTLISFSLYGQNQLLEHFHWGKNHKRQDIKNSPALSQTIVLKSFQS